MNKLLLVVVMFFTYIASAAAGNQGTEVSAVSFKNAVAYIKAANKAVSTAVATDIVNAAVIASHGNLPTFITLLAIAKKESRYTPSAVSPHGAVGIMQVMPKYHRDKLKNSDPKGIYTNMIVGARIYEKCTELSVSKIQALQCYNGSKKTNTYANGVLAFERELATVIALGPKPALEPILALVQ